MKASYQYRQWAEGCFETYTSTCGYMTHRRQYKRRSEGTGHILDSSDSLWSSSSTWGSRLSFLRVYPACLHDFVADLSSRTMAFHPIPHSHLFPWCRFSFSEVKFKNKECWRLMFKICEEKRGTLVVFMRNLIGSTPTLFYLFFIFLCAFFDSSENTSCNQREWSFNEWINLNLFYNVGHLELFIVKNIMRT